MCRAPPVKVVFGPKGQMRSWRKSKGLPLLRFSCPDSTHCGSKHCFRHQAAKAALRTVGGEIRDRFECLFMADRSLMTFRRGPGTQRACVSGRLQHSDLRASRQLAEVRIEGDGMLAVEDHGRHQPCSWYFVGGEPLVRAELATTIGIGFRLAPSARAARLWSRQA